MTTYYVSPTGNDSNAGTAGSRWQTMDKAAATLVAGDTAIFAGGTYTATSGTWQSVFTPANSGTAGNPITFQSETRGAAILAPLSSGLATWAPNSRSYLVLDGFKSTGRLGPYGGDHITIKNVELINGGIEDNDASLNWGLFLHSTNDSVIQNCYVHDMISRGNTGINTAGIMVGFGASRNTVENNLVDARGGSIYAAIGQKGGNTVSNIVRRNIVRNGYVAFFCKGSTDQTLFTDDNEFYENIIYNFSFAAFELYSNCRRTLAYNNAARNINKFMYGGDIADAGMGNVDNEAWNNILSAASSGYMRDPSTTSFAAWLSNANYNMFHNVTKVARWQSGGSFYTTLADWQAATTFDDNSLEGDPLFSNAPNMDYSLGAGSPAIGAGLAGVDMGAYPTGSGTVGPTPAPTPSPQNPRVS